MTYVCKEYVVLSVYYGLLQI